MAALGAGVVSSNLTIRTYGLVVIMVALFACTERVRVQSPAGPQSPPLGSTMDVTKVQEYTIGGIEYWYVTFADNHTSKIHRSSNEQITTAIPALERRLSALRYLADLTQGWSAL